MTKNKVEQYLDYSDSRHDNGCIFCGGQPDSRDHIPARKFLDKPYSPNLHVVPACTSCNNELSLDEEFVSFCLRYLKHLDAGDIDEYLDMRKFSHADVLEDRILDALDVSKDEPNPDVFLHLEADRIKKVLSKYAFAHFCYERGEHPEREPSQINFAFANQLTDDQIKLFDEIPHSKMMPEVGSRLFQRIIENGNTWMVIQDNSYRYYVSPNQPYVKIVISELLFAEVIFNDY